MPLECIVNSRHLTRMSTEAIEQKLIELTDRVERLEKKAKPVAKPNWREAIGMIPDDEHSREAARLGAEWRKAQNARE